MRDADQAIESVLTGLRAAEASQGIEKRILRALEERAAEKDARRSWSNWVVMPRYAGLLAGGVAVAGMLAVALLLPLKHRMRQVAVNGQRVGVSTASESLVSRGENGVSQRQNPQGEGKFHGTAQAVPWSKAANSTSSGVEVQGSQEASGTDGIPDYDALAVSEMLAPSKPAPPLPLTRQERLLARVVHKGEPEELAALKPDVRAKQMEISKAEFQEFFEPPPVKDNE